MAELRGLPLSVLLKRVYHEYARHRAIFDLPEKKFYRGFPGRDLSVKMHGMPAATPLGPAAGPHTQMAQNIVLAYLTGSRIMELKTIQILDRLKISRPCIDVQNIGFNIEWSQELRLPHSLLEYVKAHMILQILIAEKVVPADAYIFDLSVGYDLKGIRSPEVTGIIRKLMDVSETVDRLRADIPEEYRRYRDFPFPPKLVSSITLSTFHGCPKDEIERIMEYLLEEIGVHAIVKLNPVQLPKEEVEEILHGRLGYRELTINPDAYKIALTVEEAAAMLKRLKVRADRRGLSVGYKLSNTLEVLNHKDFFPKKEKVHYMSGEPLHVIALQLLKKMHAALGPGYQMSFAAGITRHNFYKAVACGLTPITVSTDFLRIGGYARGLDDLRDLEKEMAKRNAADIPTYIRRYLPDQEHLPLEECIRRNIAHVAAEALEDPRYRKERNSDLPRRLDSHLAIFDCLTCYKCIPVCPNDANFYYTVKPVRYEFDNLRVDGGRWEPAGRDFVEIRKEIQIANFIDFCNECGNCDTFCPEYGGPFIEKPSFFSSYESFTQDKTYDGFFVEARPGLRKIHGRLRGREYELEVREEGGEETSPDGPLLFKEKGNGFRIVLDRNLNVLAANSDRPVVVEMKNFYYLYILLNALLDSSPSARLHYVNAPYLSLSAVSA